MAENIFKTLEDKGIQVPEHHIQPLLAQWQAFQSMKSSLAAAELADHDMGLKHVPGGDQHE